MSYTRLSASELRRQLHWLPIRQRVKFKLDTITFRAPHWCPELSGE